MEGVTVIEFKIRVSLSREKNGMELVSLWVNTLVKQSLIKQFKFVLNGEDNRIIRFLRISTTGQDLK